MPEEILIAACALGTRGDVQPVALLCWQLAHQLQHTCSTTVITHAAHEPWLRQVLQLGDEASSTAATQQHQHQHQLHLLFVSSLPAAVWHGPQATAGDPPAGGNLNSCSSPQVRMRVCIYGARV